MKKIILAIAVCCIATFVLVSCKKDKDKAIDCNAATQKISTAAQAYATSQSAANCNAYKSALQDLLNSDCANGISASEKETFQSLINSLSCQ
jgi:hypothetical protein